MNQIFNIKRFLRYSRYIISTNRWYYGVIFVFFTIPAVILTLCEVVPELIMTLIAMPFVGLNIQPNIELTKYGGLMRQMTVPASWFEKLIVEVFVRFSALLIPVGLCSIGFSLGLGSPEWFYSAAIFGSGAEILMISMLSFLTINFDKYRKGKNMDDESVVGPNLIQVIFFGYIFGHPHVPFSQTANIVCLAIAAVAFVGALIWYPKRRLNDIL